MDKFDTEVCGFLYVKSIGHRYIAQKIRKKPLVSTKVWKRLWCSIKILGSGLETETQHWMKNIRNLLNPKRDCCTKKSYNISMVDNAHSKAAGLLGLYGNLTATETGILIKDPHKDEIIKFFEWKEFCQFHLMTAGRPEDVKRICVIHTTKEFCCGIGELYLFCLNANKLLQDLVTQGRGPKYRQKFLNLNNEICEISKYNELTSPLSQESNSLCLLDVGTDCFRTSIHSKAIENTYQSIPASLTYKELDSYSYEESDTSVASGIYEEIMDNAYSAKSRTNTSNVYEDTDEILCNVHIKPPPLPPRQRQKPEHIKKVRVNTRKCFYAEVYDFEESLQSTEICVQETTLVNNSNYVPMSPQLRGLNMFKLDTTENSRQDDYIIMQ
ncbi:uncharacterized protein LOC116851340 [Odontomachus brunneus]|uniref:uncharacterized protein LOC116851340 n=1 Tax=Odontomachus brunneus TaxID=486640 RepID=UPI0013F2261D|nr:uncharacterized protein LOC116851340 [Odontomachus brunneus]